MFFENLDYLSPKITLFYKYKMRHSSPIGGILTLIMIFICALFILKFLIRLFLHSTPSVIFYRKYENDLSKYSFDSSSIPHLIWLNNNDNENFKAIINNKAIRVILLAEENNYAANTSNLKNYEHWVYDSCENNDFSNYEELIFNDYYIYNKYNKDVSNAICIKYYYNKTEQQYYSIKNKTLNNKFKYPYLEHGISNKNNTVLSTVIEKCTNSSITNDIFGTCENEEDIITYLNEHNSAYIQVLNHQVDLTNYNKPIQSYFMGISSFLLHNNGYEVNTINFNPLLIKSSESFMNDEIIEKNSVIIDSTQSTIISNNNNILLKYLFCIQNYKQIYERKYTDLFDAFSSIGGIVQFCYYVFYIINYFYNDFILILNTQNLFLNDPKKKKITKLIPMNKRLSYTIDTKKFNKNNSIIRNYESSNYINELKYFKLVSKDQKSVFNEADISSLQLSESNNYDKESQFIFKKNKEEKPQNHLRRSFQINSKSILKFKLKDEQKKKNVIRYSMFNPKCDEMMSPRNQNIEAGKKYLSSNGDYLSNIKENISLENNNSYSKKVTFIDKRERKVVHHHSSFAGGNIKMNQLLKKKRITKITPVKNKNFKKTVFDFSQEKYYSQKLNFKEYICFICSIKKKKRRDILVIQQFRKKLLSEEHFFKSHLFIYLIIRKIKIDKEDKSDIKELYSEL